MDMMRRDAEASGQRAGVPRPNHLCAAFGSNGGHIHEVVKVRMADQDGLAGVHMVTDGSFIRGDPAGIGLPGAGACEEGIDQDTRGTAAQVKPLITQPAESNCHLLIVSAAVISNLAKNEFSISFTRQHPAIWWTPHAPPFDMLRVRLWAGVSPCINAEQAGVLN